jgi:hypothetical protein
MVVGIKLELRGFRVLPKLGSGIELSITETMRTQLVLFGIQNRSFVPYLAAI